MPKEGDGHKIADAYWREKHRDPAFIHQRDEWYAKLEADGFHDLEMTDKLTGEPSPHMLRGMSPGDLWRGLYKPDAEEYYSHCRAHTHCRGLQGRPVDRHVWSLHAEGYSIGRIHRAIGQRYGLSPGRIKKVVDRENARMMKRLEKEVQASTGAPDESR